MTESKRLEELDEIAIIGMAGRFPGAPSLDAFWRNLRDGIESVTFFTDEQLRMAGISEEVLRNPEYVKAAALLDGVEMFDAAFFGFNPREAENTDPQQRIFLECAWEALENAGYDPQAYPGRAGVYAGTGMNSYLLFNLYPDRALREMADRFQLMIGNDKDFLTTRVSYKLNLRGPSVAVQTACSTSLVAVHLACQSLLNGECDVALAGGVSVRVPQRTGYVYQPGGIASPDGHCRAFDARAGGTIFGSGAGVLVLKRLEDALAERDTIHAIIKGSAINNDGSLKVGYTAPSVESQSEVIAEALAMAAVDARTISYVEAHGTGTALGDPIEIAALTQAFHAHTKERAWCAIGSVKTNVGHLDTAAGVTGLIKTVLALKHRLLPPSLHFQEANPEIDFAASPFFVNTELTAWKSYGSPRRAGVSSFGIGGTNAHVILEEAPQPPAADPSPRPYQLMVLSARTGAALDNAARRLATELRQRSEFDVADVAYTLNTGRRAFGERRALVCADMPEVLSALEASGADDVMAASGVDVARRVAFMFPGQGAQYVHMGDELYRSERGFRQQIDLCAELLEPRLTVDLRRILYPAHGKEAEARRELDQTVLAQPALFVVEYAIARLLMKWGIKPGEMIGHSLGEYVAACLAGVFSLEDALTLLAERGRLMQQALPGAMLAVPLEEREVLARLDAHLSLAVVNGQKLCVVSGPADKVENFEQQLLAEGTGSRRLQTSHAFHSAMMDHVLEPFRALLRQTPLHPPRIPFISNVTGTWITPAQATDPNYWAEQLRRTVRFSAGLYELLRDPERLLVEVGPGNTLSTFARKHDHNGRGRRAVSTLPRSDQLGSDKGRLQHALAHLWLAGQQVNWKSYYADEQRRRRVPLPTYPFDRERYWKDPPWPADEVAGREPQRDEEGAPGREAAIPKGTKKRDIAGWFYLPSWTRSVFPLPASNEMTGKQDNRVLLFLDDCGLGTRLAARFAQSGRNVSTVAPGQRFAKTGAHAYSIRPRERSDYDALIAELRDHGTVPEQIVHLWCVTPERYCEGGGQVHDDIQYAAFYSLLFLAQALGQQRELANIDLRIISNEMQAATGAEAMCPEKALLLGPCKVFPQEYKNLRAQSIDIAIQNGAGTIRLVDQLMAELAAETDDRIIAYRGVHRLVQRFEPVQVGETPSGHPRLRPGGVYLITGGTGGIGLVLAEWLAREARAKLVLTGSSPFPARQDWAQWLASHSATDELSRKIRKVRALEEFGAEVMAVSANVTDEFRMRNLVEEVEARFGSVNGVIHAAGIAGGTLAQLETASRAGLVLAPKVEGTRVLGRILQEKELDFFLLCSSVNSILGGYGQTDYCAANAFLDAFTHKYASGRNTLTCSVNWTTWREVGMAASGVRATEAKNAAQVKELKGASSPLFDSRTDEEGDQVTYVTGFNTAKHWVLSEHRIIRGQGVVPGTAYLEMARAAAAPLAGGRIIEIRDALFIEPFIVSDGETREVETVLEKQGEGIKFRFRCKSELQPGPAASWQEYARGQLAFLPPVPLVSHDIEGFVASHGMVEIDISSAVSARLKANGFGPRWDTLKRAFSGPRSALALLQLPREFIDDLKDFPLHPALLDIATGFAWLNKAPAGYYLPMSYKRLTTKAPLAEKIYSLVTYKDEILEAPEAITCNVVLMDERGVELVNIEKFSAWKVRDFAAAEKKKDARPALPAPVTTGGGEADYITQMRQRALADGITPSEGVSVLKRILAGSLQPQVIISTKDFNAAVKEAKSFTLERLPEIKPVAAAPPAQRHTRPKIKTEYVAPETDLEQRLAEVWQEALGLEQAGIYDNFFELGGDSVLAIHIIARSHQEGLQLTPQELFQYPTIAALAAVLSGKKQNTERPVASEASDTAHAAENQVSGMSQDFPLAGLDTGQFAELSRLVDEIDNA